VVLERLQRTVFPAWIAATVLTVVFLASTLFFTDILARFKSLLPGILAVLSLLCTGGLIKVNRTGWAFITGSLTIIFASAMIFAGLYPRILISSLDPAFSLTITNAASSPYTLKVMSIVAAIFIPIVVLYQAWTYWIFRKRLDTTSEKFVY
jgi:cytochrome d ubiquinol oxidase subunit II